MYKKMIALGMCLALCSHAATATMAYRIGLIEDVRFDSHTRVGFEDAVWVKIRAPGQV